MMRYRTLSNTLDRFIRDEYGAVTVDWVVLSAAVIGLALATHTVWRSSAGVLAADISATASDYQIKTSFD